MDHGAKMLSHSDAERNSV